MLRKLKGFTLIELLIVIAIIAILTVAFLPTLRGGQAGARDAAKIALLGNLSVAFEKAINDGTPALPDDVSAVAPISPVLPNITAGSGVCVYSYAVAPGNAIASILGRVPQSFTSSGGTMALCGMNGLWYNKVSGTSYILVMQVEEYKNANVEANTTGAVLQVVNAVSGTGPTAISVTDGPLPTAAAAAPFFYIIAK